MLPFFWFAHKHSTSYYWIMFCNLFILFSGRRGRTHFRARRVQDWRTAAWVKCCVFLYFFFLKTCERTRNWFLVVVHWLCVCVVGKVCPFCTSLARNDGWQKILIKYAHTDFQQAIIIRTSCYSSRKPHRALEPYYTGKIFNILIHL